MNESGTFRKVYHPLKESNSAHIHLLKMKAEELEALMKKFNNREMSLALTNLEQSIMWATKAIVLDDEKENSHEKTN